MDQVVNVFDFDKLHSLCLSLAHKCSLLLLRRSICLDWRPEFIALLIVVAHTFAIPSIAVIDRLCQAHQICSIIYFWQCVGSGKVN